MFMKYLLCLYEHYLPFVNELKFHCKKPKQLSVLNLNIYEFRLYISLNLTSCVSIMVPDH